MTCARQFLNWSLLWVTHRLSISCSVCVTPLFLMSASKANNYVPFTWTMNDVLMAPNGLMALQVYVPESSTLAWVTCNAQRPFRRSSLISLPSYIQLIIWFAYNFIIHLKRRRKNWTPCLYERWTLIKSLSSLLFNYSNCFITSIV